MNSLGFRFLINRTISSKISYEMVGSILIYYVGKIVIFADIVGGSDIVQKYVDVI